MVFPRTRRRLLATLLLLGTVTAQTIIWTQPVPPPVRTVIRCPFA